MSQAWRACSQDGLPPAGVNLVCPEGAGVDTEFITLGFGDGNFEDIPYDGEAGTDTTIPQV